MIIILERDKVTHKVRQKLLKKGLSLIGISDTEIIFAKLKRHFLIYPRFHLVVIYYSFISELIKCTRKTGFLLNQWDYFENIVVYHFKDFLRN